MSDRRLGTLETYRLIDDVKALPRDERRRISRATFRGVALASERERNMQRSLMAQTSSWLITLLAVFTPLQAINGWTHYAADHSLLQLFGSAATTLATPPVWWQWWSRRRLTRRLDALLEPTDASPTRS